MQNSSSWGMHSPTHSTPSRNPFQPRHSASIADFWTRRPLSAGSSSSSSSYDPVVYRRPHRNNFYGDHSLATTPTPTTPTTPKLAFQAPASSHKIAAMSSTNPFARMLAAKEQTPPISPGSSSPSSMPQDDDELSRSSTPTPIAPQPVKPNLAALSFVGPMDDAPQYPFSPFTAFVTPQTQGAPYTVGFDDKLFPQFITPELLTQNSRRIPQIAIKKGWSSPALIYTWAMKHYKTAFLLWMADELQAWPKAMVMGLEDASLPYTEDDLRGIAQNLMRVTDLQWKVAIKQLPREGTHTEFKTNESIPLEVQQGVRMRIPENLRKVAKRMDCVKFHDRSTDSIFVRKRLDVKNSLEKEAILAQIRDFHLISHPNIAKIEGSYARGQTVGILSLRCEVDLVEYLESLVGAADQLLSWTIDLASALKYLHDNNIAHRSVRPNKILIDPQKNHIFFSVFGIVQPARSSGTSIFAPYSSDPAYVYGAPETIHRRECGSAADIFGLACVFLEMVTAARMIDFSEMEEYRSQDSHDRSYHMNLERVDSWMQHVRNAKPTSRRDRHGPAIDNVLTVVRSMVSADPDKRPNAKRVLQKLESQTRRTRRRSDVGAEIGRAMMENQRSERTNDHGIWGGLEQLENWGGYYQSGYQGYSNGTTQF